MASHKTPDDEAYEQGVQDGQGADAFDQVAHSLTKGVSLPGERRRQTEIYNKGYNYGVGHQHERHTVQAARTPVSSSEAGCAEAIAKLIVVGVIVAGAVWLLANVVVPVVLLNSAVICTILALTVPTRRKLFASLALLGACCALVDLANGWLSANFVRNVVHTTSWLTVFVYLNAFAVACSLWMLLHWLRSKAIEVAKVSRYRGAAIGAGLAIIVASPYSLCR